MEDAKKKRGNRWLFVFLGCMFFIISGLVVAVIMNMDHPVNTGNDDMANQETLFDNWGEYMADGDMERFIEATNEEIEATSDAETKSIIYASRAGVLNGYNEANNNIYSAQVLDDAYSAEECYPTGQTAYLVYMYEQKYGDPAMADEYLNIAKERGMAVPPGKG